MAKRRIIMDDEMNSEPMSVEKCQQLEDPSIDRFPFAIVWTSIPMITWILPFIGHVGICDSQGRVWDFAAPYFVGVDNMAFGRPRKY
eukprot:MONOS_13091.1-p1 / transcript=MONOS_13091.1 / gene=MONOS_13091 / organism=Monocercomonoides_exilis_PA203 / gene_product=transmembrane protein / transcript_product=transmembrane protein / location=Mono_scaffold00777:8050-8393(-) / protein_length=86 / sequence_SO=supercontig / SO=protein_coding / is_pseudo=false